MEKKIATDTPLYRHDAAYAREHGELSLYRESYQANIACKEAIEGLHVDDGLVRIFHIILRHARLVVSLFARSVTFSVKSTVPTENGVPCKSVVKISAGVPSWSNAFTLYTSLFKR